MEPPLDLVRRLLIDARLHEPHCVRGEHRGRDVEVRFVRRGTGAAARRVTELCLLDVARRADLRLHILPKTASDVREAAAGRGTVVAVGDADFDDAFFVEAAPEDVVRRIFDESIRTRMRALRPMAVHTLTRGLALERAEWSDDPMALRELVDLGVSIAEAIPRAFEAADHEVGQRLGYRTTAMGNEIAARRRAEVSTLLWRKRAREHRRITQTCLLLALTMLAATVVWMSVVWATAVPR